MNYNYKVSIIMPALNEEDNITGAVRNVKESFFRFGIPGEIIIINDGSTDKTKEIIYGLIKECPYIRVIDHLKPSGIGASFWEGVKESKGEIVTLLPGDGENDASEALRYISLMESVDIIVPFVFNEGVRTWKRRMLSKFYKAIINLSFGILLNYMNGTVMYRKCILEDMDLNAAGFFFQTELLIRCIKTGYLYAEVPYALRGRAAGRSKAVTMKSLLAVVKSYLTALHSVYLLNKGNKYFAKGSVTALRKSGLGG